MNRLLAAASALTLAVAAPASAATQIVVGGELTGATGVTVGGSTYNVEFVDGTCAALFGGCTSGSNTFAFHSQADADAAAAGLFAQVVTGTFDTSPALTAGCDSATLCSMLIPWGFSATDFAASAAGNLVASNSTSQTTGSPTTLNTGSQTAFVWARFTPATGGAVPEPSTWAMMLLGFAGIGLAARRRGRRLSAA